MTLDQYMRERGLDPDQMAALIGEPCSEGAVRKWRSGERIPRKAQMARIVAATKGAVTAADFFDASQGKAAA